MKTKKIELDLDFISGLGPLIAEEEKALNDFLKQRKLSSRKNLVAQKIRTMTRTKSTNC